MNRELLSACSIGEAVSLKTSSSAFLAGGTEIFRKDSSIGACQLIVLSKAEGIRGISRLDDHTVRAGSMTTFQEAAESDILPDYFRKAAGYMASRTKRNMATLGGNIALRRDDSYLFAVLIASHARLDVDIWENGCLKKERICIRRYLLNKEMYENALIEAVILRDDVKVVSMRFANTAESHSFLTAAIGCVDGHTRIGLCVKNSGVYFLKELSSQADMAQDPERLFADFAKTWEGLDIADDIYGTSAYKRYLLSVTLTDLFRDLRKSQGKEADLT